MGSQRVVHGIEYQHWTWLWLPLEHHLSLLGQGYSKGYSVRKEGEKEGEAIQLTKECSEELYEVEGCHRQEGGARRLLFLNQTKINDNITI